MPVLRCSFTCSAVFSEDGVKALAGEFKEVAITEMKHAEKLAERIDYLGGDPTTKPEQIMGRDATSVADMAAADRDSEADAVARYKEAIGVAANAGDVTTRKMLEDILGDEEDHHKTFSDMLG
jgi:bacterioferritin